MRLILTDPVFATQIKASPAYRRALLCPHRSAGAAVAALRFVVPAASGMGTETRDGHCWLYYTRDDGTRHVVGYLSESIVDR